jgi:hypothetical protein
MSLRLAPPIAALVVAGFGAVCWWHGQSVDHFTVLNDFWGNAFAADHWQWNARRLWNGFFPPGYPFLLTMLPGDRLPESAYNANVLAGMALLATIWTFFRRWSSPATGFLAMALVAAHPLVLTQVLTTGPDVLLVTVTAIGALSLFHIAALPAPDVRVALIGGVALGLAGWLRYHAFPWSAALLIAALLIGGRPRWRVIAVVTAPIAAAGLGLVALGLAAGDLSALPRDQAFNTFVHLVEAPNWFHLPPPAALPSTVWEAIARNPAAFRQNYLTFSAPHLWLLVPPLAAIVFGTGAARRFGAFTLVATLIFVPIVNLGASPRGVACVVPLMLGSAAWAMTAALDRLRGPLRLPIAVAGTMLLAVCCWRVWAPEIIGYVEAARARHAMSQALESKLRADKVRFAMQVFSTTELYFVGATGREVAAYHPRIMGGWPSVDLPAYNHVYPAPSARSFDEFLADCHRFGITHLALGSASSSAQRELGQLFDGRLTSDRVQEIPGVPGVRLFRIVG